MSNPPKSSIFKCQLLTCNKWASVVTDHDRNASEPHFPIKNNIHMTAYIYEYKPIVFKKLENQNMNIQNLFFNIVLDYVRKVD